MLIGHKSWLRGVLAKSGMICVKKNNEFWHIGYKKNLQVHSDIKRVRERKVENGKFFTYTNMQLINVG